MTDDMHSGVPGPDDFPTDFLSHAAEVLPGELAEATDDSEAIGMLVSATGLLCSILAFELYRWDDWASDHDRDTVAHLVGTMERICRHLIVGVDLHRRGAHDVAWTLLDAARRLRAEIGETLRHDDVEDQARRAATRLDAVSARRPAVGRWGEWAVEDGVEVMPVDATGLGIALTAGARSRRTPAVFVDEDALGERFRTWTVDLLRGSLDELAAGTRGWGVEHLDRIREIVVTADAARIERFRPPDAA